MTSQLYAAGGRLYVVRAQNRKGDTHQKACRSSCHAGRSARIRLAVDQLAAPVPAKSRS